MLSTRITKFILLIVLMFPYEVFAETGFFQDVGLNFHGYYWARRFSVYQPDADSDSGIGGVNYLTQELRLYPELELNENVNIYMDLLVFSTLWGKTEGTVLTFDVSDSESNIILKRI